MNNPRKMERIRNAPAKPDRTGRDQREGRILGGGVEAVEREKEGG